MPYEQYFNNISFKYPRDWSLLTGIFLECCLQLELKYFKASVHIRKNKQGPIYILYVTLLYVAISSVPQSCPTLCNSMDCSMPGFPVHHQRPEPTQTHVHWVSDAVQPSHPLLSPSPPALNLSQHQGIFQWVGSLIASGGQSMELQLQHQSFQWIFRVDFF